MQSYSPILGLLRFAMYLRDYLPSRGFVLLMLSHSPPGATSEQQKAALDIWDRNVVPDHPSEDEAISTWIKARNRVPNLPATPGLPIYAPVSNGTDSWRRC